MLYIARNIQSLLRENLCFKRYTRNLSFINFGKSFGDFLNDCQIVTQNFIAEMLLQFCIHLIIVIFFAFADISHTLQFLVPVILACTSHSTCQQPVLLPFSCLSFAFASPSFQYFALKYVFCSGYLNSMFLFNYIFCASHASVILSLHFSHFDICTRQDISLMLFVNAISLCQPVNFVLSSIFYLLTSCNFDYSDFLQSCDDQPLGYTSK